ncbi:MAG: hypothetical protein UY41_C0045G0005 [Candidatus Moranbacteria bacterium GW2011_GWE1_49_15]|nr:MAG: hypothetical protein UX75_C0049G0005 [Candidatus Moranbacteria bacterium GW2011_GWE2_47_10]KKW05619.1 MAG: hypothetical protein UY41_C0045G0005 [Candidatus Moranbacteria bacterium GW2011_GWE1_49_15]
MKNKIRKIFYHSLAFSFLPLMASAQVFVGSGNPIVDNAAGYGLPQGSILGILSTFLTWIMAVFGILGVLGFIISGILYLTAAGDTGQIDKAKTAMVNSIIGIVVGLSGFIVIQAAQRWLTGYNRNF